MSVNYLSSSRNTSLHSQASSSNASNPFLCFDSAISGYIVSTLILTNIIILLPLSAFILSLGFQRWKQQRSASSATAMSLSDYVTYHLAVMELVGVLGNIVSAYGGYNNHHVITWAGLHIGIFPWYGQMLFPVLTCVERYMAVVHPITFLRLRQRRGVCFRNATVGYIWLQCFAGTSIVAILLQNYELSLMLNICQMALFLIATTFCSLSAVCILTRPRPGEAGGNRVWVDRSKQKAFNTIMVIMGVLMLRFGGNLVCYVVGLSTTVSYDVLCVVNSLPGWFNLPSSLVLPLLFLHRAGKLPGCKHKHESG